MKKINNRNKMNKSIIATACFLAGTALTSFYYQSKTISFDEKVIFNNIVNMYPKAKEDIYKIVPLGDDMALTILSSGEKFISSNDGKTVVHSMSRTGMSAYKVNGDQVVDIVSVARKEINKEIVSKELMHPIVFKSKNEIMELNVFIEPFCGYCLVLHENMQSYLDAGFTIKYYPLPIFGEKSEKIFQSIWSIEDHELQKQELNRVLHEISLKTKGATYTISELSLNEATKNGVISTVNNTNAGRRMGVTSTPALVTNNGEVIPGAIPPEKLKQIFNIK
jgi:thiol:disulfide interchange protein DsbC